jgi:hypothetical protein
MKKLLATMVLWAGLAVTVYGQGIIIQNAANPITSTSMATSGGLVWTNNFGNLGLWDGLHYNLGITVFVGATSSSLYPLVTILPDPSIGNYTGSDYGYFTPIGLPRTFDTELVPGATAWVELQVWQWEWSGGPFNSFAAAEAAGDMVAAVLFQNPTGNPNSIPPTPDQSLTGMPALLFAFIPEPGTIAIAGLGAVLLLAFRRRS